MIPTDLPPAQMECISNVIHNEARSESFIGQQAVGHVILNRSMKYDELPCVIVKQKNQFKYTPGKWHRSYTITIPDPTKGALYFKNFRGKSWKYRYTITIGNHKFYK